MMKVLVPIDGSNTSYRAVGHAIAHYKGRDDVEVHVLNVQDRADAPELLRFRTAEEIERAQREHGESILKPACRKLDRAGIACKAHVRIGEAAETIADFARRGRFQKIVMGSHGRGAVTGLLMGSIATKVLHLSTVPVTLVK